MAAADSNRRELAGFLRSRRERITPKEVGLPAGPRRRTTGLRREEVAVLAGLSPTWYTYLEQGRDIHPSPEVLDSLARVLSLTEDERRYMHRLTHGGATPPPPLKGDISAEELVKRLVKSHEDTPYPIYGANLYSDIVAWNRATTEWYTDFGVLPAAERNMMRWMFGPEAGNRIDDWENDAAEMVARWRSLTAPWSDDPRLNLLIDDLKRNEDFARLWDGHDVRELRSRVRRFLHPRLGVQPIRLILVQAAEFAPCLVVFHVPAHPGDDPTLAGRCHS